MSEENREKSTNTSKDKEAEPRRQGSVNGNRPSARPEQIVRNSKEDSKMLSNCLAKNRQLTEDLVCFRNLKALYTRHFVRMQAVVSGMQNDQMIQIHPYSPEFQILVQAMSHKHCLTVVDELEKVIIRLDKFLFQIEPVDWSKELIFGGICLCILFCFYYIYRYMKMKQLIFALLFFVVYAHEYYYLLLAKKSENANTLRRHEINCRQGGWFISAWRYLAGALQSVTSFNGDECDLLNEHYLYIDAALTINPLEPVFTVVPKLFSKSMIIMVETSAIAFGKFCAQLPLFHAYPILILFIGLVVSIFYLLITWHVKLRTVDYDHQIRLRRLSSYEVVGGESRFKLTAPERASIESDSRPTDRPEPSAIRSHEKRPENRPENRTECRRRLEYSRPDSNQKENISKKQRSEKCSIEHARFDGLDRRICLSRWKGERLASALKRTKSLDFIPVF